MNKIYKIDDYNLILRTSNYSCGNSLAVYLETQNEEMYAVLTVNLETPPNKKNCAFVDTNNLKWVEDFLQKNEIAQPTGIYGISGFCTYPEYEFDIEKIIKENK